MQGNLNIGLYWHADTFDCRRWSVEVSGKYNGSMEWIEGFNSIYSRGCKMVSSDVAGMYFSITAWDKRQYCVTFWGINTALPLRRNSFLGVSLPLPLIHQLLPSLLPRSPPLPFNLIHQPFRLLSRAPSSFQEVVRGHSLLVGMKGECRGGEGGPHHTTFFK